MPGSRHMRQRKPRVCRHWQTIRGFRWMRWMVPPVSIPPTGPRHLQAAILKWRWIAFAMSLPEHWLLRPSVLASAAHWFSLGQMATTKSSKGKWQDS
ncbi:UNVERIFIED_CONTAM: hypothetical protein NCL1_06692 [Trichonephila clavipes]